MSGPVIVEAQSGTGATPPRIEVELQPANAPAYAAIVSLHGEHDLATSGDVESALAGIYGPVLVDLTACEFVDTTVVRIILAKRLELEREGHRLELVIPPENQINRTLEVLGLASFMIVHERVPGDGASG
jgi:anti-anti-sigma factor